ncbi:MAG: hypothetical protein RIG68_20220 [Imperialibacter sp.]|uniref:hypothetical protein n=1 Tax=Imperialibacter sp. TaxID=2038411 RepID=UPI0032EE1350
MGQVKKSSADQVDMHRRLLFGSMLLLSLVFGIKTALYLVNGATTNYLNVVAKVVVAVALVLLGITVFWKLRFVPGKDRYYLLTSTDSFVAQVMNRACRISWSLTFSMLCLTMMFTSRDSSFFPTEFYLNLAAFFMLATFSVSFFILFKTEGDEEFSSMDT